jgi:hypothetical protein
MLLLLWKNIAVIPLIGLSVKPEPALSIRFRARALERDVVVLDCCEAALI